MADLQQGSTRRWLSPTSDQRAMVIKSAAVLHKAGDQTDAAQDKMPRATVEAVRVDSDQLKERRLNRQQEQQAIIERQHEKSEHECVAPDGAPHFRRSVQVGESRFPSEHLSTKDSLPHLHKIMAIWVTSCRLRRTCPVSGGCAIDTSDEGSFTAEVSRRKKSNTIAQRLSMDNTAVKDKRERKGKGKAALQESISAISGRAIMLSLALLGSRILRGITRLPRRLWSRSVSDNAVADQWKACRTDDFSSFHGFFPGKALKSAQCCHRFSENSSYVKPISAVINGAGTGIFDITLRDLKLGRLSDLLGMSPSASLVFNASMLDPSSFAERTLGCTLIGVILTTLLYGCSLGQTIIYLQRYQRDSAYIKVLVVILWLFNTCKTVIDIQFLWNALVQEHSHFARLFKVADIFGAEYVIGAVISFIAQCYFLNIIWKLLRSKWYGRALTIVGVSDFDYADFNATNFAQYISTLISLVSSIGGVYEVYSTTKLIKIEKSILIQGSLHVAAACFTDILITTSLCVFLRRSRTGFRRTETILSTLMVWTTNRGVLDRTNIAAYSVYCGRSPRNAHHRYFLSPHGRIIRGLDARYAQCSHENRRRLSHSYLLHGNHKFPGNYSACL
ncbi:hypothetical protein WOLCODRAFT_146494, partial [Wolfiporia cocos MD-104 SS10]